MTDLLQPIGIAAGQTLNRRSILLGRGAAGISGAAWAEYSSPLVSRNFRSRRQATHYIECGPADGPLMIFLHGWPTIGLMWRAQMEAFADDGWHCVAPDLRGFGSSTGPG